MLEKQINGFIDYCKVSGLKVKSIELKWLKWRKMGSSLSISLIFID